jgi:hypothetical protein
VVSHAAQNLDVTFEFGPTGIVHGLRSYHSFSTQSASSAGTRDFAVTGRSNVGRMSRAKGGKRGATRNPRGRSWVMRQ